jgi:eukaryotic translation initiation factor 2C
VPAAEATDLAAEPYNPRHPLRPGYGTLGTEVILRANFFPITIPKRPILEYTVSIEPAAGSRKLKTRLFQLLEQNVAFQPHINYTAHDHSARLVASQRLPQPLDVRITFIGEGMTVALPNAREYTVSIVANGKLETSELQKYVFPGLRVRVFRVRANSIHRYVSADPTARDYNPLPVISALNLVLRQHASRGGFRLGRNQYFFTPNEHLQLSMGVDAWQGYFLSVRPTFKQLMVNVNVCMSAFYEPGNLGNVLQAFQHALGRPPTRFIRRLTVRTRHLGHVRAVWRIVPTPPAGLWLNNVGLGGMITLAQYFTQSLYFFALALLDR